MILHVLHQRSWSIEGTPFDQELSRLEVNHVFLNAKIDLLHTSWRQLVFRIYPALIWNTVRLAVRSLTTSPRPDAILLSTGVEAIITGLLRCLLRRRTLVVMQTLIVNPRGGRLTKILYMAYWRCVVSLIDVAICHSQAEIDSYAALFPARAGIFAFIPYGTTISLDGPVPQPDPAAPIIVTAGRSGRDYPTLVRAVDGLPCRLQIICDMPGPVSGLPASDQVEVLTRCFGDDYLRTVAAATIVAVPLSVEEVSAGQMVFLQAAALARPIVLTRTHTTTDYAEDGRDALLVPRDDAAAMRTALTTLLTDPDLRERLGQNARDTFRARFSTEAYVRNVVALIARRLSARAH